MKKLFLKYWPPIIIFIISFIYLIFLLPPGITFEDAGYFLAASLNWGYAHPPGYPLYTVLLGLWSALMGLFTDNAAFMGSLFSSLLSALSLSFFYFILRFIFSDRPENSILHKVHLICLCLLTGLSFEFLEQSLLIEVYSLHIILLMLLFLSLINTKYLLTGLVTGLALANHSTAIFFFPFTLLWLLLIDQKSIKSIIKPALNRFLPGTLLGLIPYLYMPVIYNPESPLQWGVSNTWAGFKEIAFRTSYWRLPASKLSTQVEQVKVAITHFFDQWGLALPSIIFILSFLIYFLVKNKRKALYWHICWLIQLPVMAILANMSTTDEGIKLVSVFFIPAYFFTIACWLLFTRAVMLWKQDLANKTLYCSIGLAALGIILSLAINTPRVNMSKYSTPKKSTTQIEKMVNGQKSIILTWNDFAFTPIAYEKYVLKKFPNLHPVPHTFFKDLGMINKYKKILNINLSPLKKAVTKFYLTRPAGHIGTISDDVFYEAFAENIKIWLDDGYKVFSEYKMNGKGFKTLYFDPKGSFFQILLNKPIKESSFVFLENIQTQPIANNDVWHKKFLSKYAEQNILKALLNRNHSKRDQLLKNALKFSMGTESEQKVREGVAKHFPSFKK